MKTDVDQITCFWFQFSDEIKNIPFHFENLVPIERKNATRFQDQAIRERFIMGRSILRQILVEYTGAQRDFTLEHRSSGKLHAQGLSGHFSLSHTENFWVSAISEKRKIGVDVECLERDIDVVPLYERFFSSDEQRYFDTLTPTQRKSRFLEVWTRKEALIKGREGAIADGLDTFGNAILSEQSDQVLGQWRLKKIVDLPPRYIGHLALENSEPFDYKLVHWRGCTFNG